MNRCKICNSIANPVFNQKVLNKYNVNYFKCNKCEYLFTEEPFWLEEAYSRPINISDTGLLNRNIVFSQILSILIYFNFNKNALFLDYAGGYGVFTRLMRDVGFDFYWYDVYTQNLFANGFEIDIETNPKFELITAFEVFEHLENPKAELEKMLQLSNTVILSTELIPEQMLIPKKWWYYGFEHGQHISFYSSKTFKYLADIFNLKFYNIKGFPMLTEKELNLSKLTLLKKMRHIGLFNYVKKKMTSKTVDDSKKLIKFDFN
jgi:hypothetical protein